MAINRMVFLDRARALLKEPEETNIRYGCLELRLFMEALVYEKMEMYKDRIPAAFYEIWQPPQLFRSLKELEPLADQGYMVHFTKEVNGEPSGESFQIGEHRMIPLRVLRTAYNKVGSFLHLNRDSVKHASVFGESVESSARTLNEMLRELERVGEKIFDFNLAEVSVFNCLKCQHRMIRNAEYLLAPRKIICDNRSCGAEHQVVRREGNLEIELMTSRWECQRCSAPIPIENKRMAVGFRFNCSACGASHRIVARKWDYLLEVDDVTGVST
jgi:hypothetical protein